MKHLVYFAVLFLVSCSSPRIVYDYDTELNFETYKTFNFFEDVGEGLNKFDVDRITREIKTNLESKGLRQTNNPNFYINVFSKVKRENHQNSTLGVTIGGGNRGFGYGISGGIPIGGRKLQQQITIDFVESKDNQLIWQSIFNSQINEKITPEKQEAYYKKLIKSVLKGYPPERK